MEDRRTGGEAGEDPRSLRRVLPFVCALAGYYVLYYGLFISRVGEYFADIVRHFAFVRRILP
jgi:hypothetical protein